MENTRAKTTRNSLILLLTATIWGMAFVSQSKGMDYMHPFTFNGVRSLIGAAGILVYILISRKIAGDKAAKLDWKLNVRAGLLCGIFLTIASTLQQFGIKYTSVGKAGFITTLYIIFVPMFGIFLKKKVAPVVWAAAGMAAALPGVIAANTTLPVIGVPIKGSVLDGVDALYSIIQMPPGIPVATVAINGAMNAAILAVQMLALSDKELAEAFTAYKEGLKKKIVKANEDLKEVKYEYKTN